MAEPGGQSWFGRMTVPGRAGVVVSTQRVTTSASNAVVGVGVADGADGSESAGESHKERLDRELQELLDEVRVAIPGAEVLFAFLLGIAFTERFSSVTTLQRAVYFAVLLLTAAATALLMAPTAYHRLRFRDGDKERMLFTMSRTSVAALVLLCLAVSGTIFLVGDVLYDSAVAGAVSGATFAWFLWFWFGLPLLRRARQAEAS